jgi:hypothetical protein
LFIFPSAVHRAKNCHFMINIVTRYFTRKLEEFRMPYFVTMGVELLLSLIRYHAMKMYGEVEV